MSSLYLNDKSVHPHILLDGVYKLHLVENVQLYTMTKDYTNRYFELSGSGGSFEKKHYFAIDLVHHDAFGHWVYESAVYLPLFRRLQELYPGIQLLLKGKKRYKTMFLQFFNIDEADVSYSIDGNFFNLCLFPSLITSLNDNMFFTEDYKRISMIFMHIFRDYDTPASIVSYDRVIMPRQTLENYKNNDRKYPIMYDIIEKYKANSLVINTDELTDLTEQIRMVRSAPVVMLTDGSPFLVNILFCRNQSIYVVDNITENQNARFFKFRFIVDTICNMNSIDYKHL
jgi:capsular polysaccharide biosynthesis protein